MGNQPSSSDNEDNDVVDIQTLSKDRILETEHFQTCEYHKVNDLSQLFDNSMLRLLASKFKDEIPGNLIQQEYDGIVNWLETAASANEETVRLGQFCEFLGHRVNDREECVQAFELLDSEGDGVADITAALDTLRSSLGPHMNHEIIHAIRRLQGCISLPGFIDVCSPETSGVSGKIGAQILNFLLRNRASVSELPYTAVDGFNNITSMREQVLRNLYTKLDETGTPDSVESAKSKDGEVVTVNKVYSHIEVSSSQPQVHEMTDGDPNSYWQSNGTAGNHWIRLLMRPNVMLKQLSIYVSNRDESYMPSIVGISVGDARYTLHEIKEIKIAKATHGEVVLLENLQSFHKVIEIKIKGCHADGCDTRIRGLKTLGYRIVREPGISVLDASAMWYFRVLASLGRACQSVIPGIRSHILDHSRLSLKHMPPLSLSGANTDKPAFLSNEFLDEIHTFLSDMAVCEDKSVSSEGVQVLLAFGLARGHVISILNVIEKIFDNAKMKIDVGLLNESMASVLSAYRKKSAQPLRLSVRDSDGSRGADNAPHQLLVLTSTSKSLQFYEAEPGRDKLNIFFKSQRHVQLTRVRLMLKKGVKGNKHVLVFVYNDESEFVLDAQVQRFVEFDSNTNQLTSTSPKSGGDFHGDAGLAKVLTIGEDVEDVDVFLEGCPVGQTVLVKILAPQVAAEDTIGVNGFHFYGFHKNKCQALKMPEPEHISDVTLRNKVTLLHKVLEFLAEIALQQHALPKTDGTKSNWLDTCGMTVADVWRLYEITCARKELGCGVSTECLILQLVHALLPYLTPGEQEDKLSCQAFLEHLSSSMDSEANECKRVIVKHILIDGVPLFFPDRESRREKLFSMMENVQSSLGYLTIFQALCHHYSTVDPTGLLDLNTSPFNECRSDELVAVMSTLLRVVYREFAQLVSTRRQNEQSSHVVTLVSSLQTSLLAWCQRQVPPGRRALLPKHVEKMVFSYCTKLLTNAVNGIKAIQALNDEDLPAMLVQLETSFLAGTVRQLCVQLLALTANYASGTLTDLVRQLLALAGELNKLLSRIPGAMKELNEGGSTCESRDDVTLKTWEVESPHPYDNNQHTVHEFYCGGATRFVVQFDPRCHTEKCYDYLELTDASGYKKRYDRKVGTESWPNLVTFQGPRLHFLFTSDGSAVEWGYKFTVQAKGKADVQMSWIVDLQLSLSALTGRICGMILSSKPTLAVSPTPVTSPEVGGEQIAETIDTKLLESELWNSLLRGGHIVGKLQRSLSGYMTASSIDAGAHTFIQQVMHQETDLAKSFIQSCRDQHRSHDQGGLEVDEVVLATFSALIWHTQALRDEIDKYVENDGTQPLAEGLLQAYTVAESMRNYILDFRQRQTLSEEQLGVSEDGKENIAVTFKEKAIFLLSFAGLTKITPRVDFLPKKSGRLKKLSVLSRQTSIDQDKNKHESTLNERFPSFRLVLDFIRDPMWRKEQVEALLHQRATHAHAVAETYMLVAEYLRIMSAPHVFQTTNIVLLRELLRHQAGFPKHYADGLDGCGLTLESSVRRSYYTLLKRLLEPIHEYDHNKEKDESMKPDAVEFVRACLLHLLDTRWQPFDFAFLWEAKLPSLLMDIGKGSAVKRSSSWSAVLTMEEELKQYKDCVGWLAECKQNFSSWHARSKHGVDGRKEMAMFVARYCDQLDVQISCDGCFTSLPGRRYRCLSCEDVDLCSTCFGAGKAPLIGAQEHTPEHRFVDLRHKCDDCSGFIVGTRFHCTICEDFDLCVGCEQKHEVYSKNGHVPSHEMRKFPMQTFNSVKSSDYGLPAYTRHHAWLLYASLALSMSYLHNHQLVQAPYQAYTAQLHDICIKQLMHCLEGPAVIVDAGVVDDCTDSSTVVAASAAGDNDHVTSVAAVMPVSAAGEPPEPVVVVETKELAALDVNLLERTMGLLAAMIPDTQDQQTSDDAHLLQAEPFLTLLFSIAKGDNRDGHCMHLPMAMLARLLPKASTSCSVCDAAVAGATGTVVPADSTPGDHTINYLITTGARRLEKCYVQLASSNVSLLQHLFVSGTWRPVLEKHVRKAIENDKTSPMTSLFALLVVAGLPEVLSVGVCVDYSRIGLDEKEGVIVKHLDGMSETMIVDTRTRRVQLVNDEYVSVRSPSLKFYEDDDQVSPVVALIDVLMEIIKEDGVYSVDRQWIRALCLKVLYKDLRSPKAKAPAYRNKLYSVEFLQRLVQLACRGTGFEKQWYLKDLETLSLKLYVMCNRNSPSKPSLIEQQKLNLTMETAEEAMKALSGLSAIHSKLVGFSAVTLTESDSDSDSDDDSDCDSESDESNSDASDDTLEGDGATSLGNDVIGDVTPIIKSHFKAITKALKMSATVLYGLYRAKGNDMLELLDLLTTAVQGTLDSLESKKGVPCIDEGIQLVRDPQTMARTASSTGLSAAARSEIVAEDEPYEKDQQLVASAQHESHRDVFTQLKQKSTKLLNSTLKSQNEAPSDECLMKVNQAVAILYARDVLISLLADWPSDVQPLTARLLGCESDSQIPCLIDLLYNTENVEAVKKMVDNLMRTCDESCLAAVSEAASRFVEEQGQTAVIVESAHNYEDNKIIQDKVRIAGATFLSVRFDARCHTEEYCDTLVIATTPDFRENKFSFSGTRENWKDFEVPGDTLYYMFKSDASKNEWGYKFSVMGGRLNRFDTGFLILDALLQPIHSRALALDKIWQSLCSVACQQTGKPRLRIIHLLLKIIGMQRKSSAAPLVIEPRLLAPLWHLYMRSSSAPCEPGSIVAPVVRALTELFVVVEDLVLEHGIEAEYSASVRTASEWKKIILEGLLNVAAVKAMTTSSSTNSALSAAVDT